MAKERSRKRFSLEREQARQAVIAKLRSINPDAEPVIFKYCPHRITRHGKLVKTRLKSNTPFFVENDVCGYDSNPSDPVAPPYEESTDEEQE